MMPTRQPLSIDFDNDNIINLKHFPPDSEIGNGGPISVRASQYFSPLFAQVETAYPPPIEQTDTSGVGTDITSGTSTPPSIFEITMIFPTDTPSRTPSPTLSMTAGADAKDQGSKNTARYGLIFLVALLWLLLGGWLYLLVREMR